MENNNRLNTDNDSYDCVQAIIHYVAKKWRRKYELMFINSWDFRYIPMTNTELEESNNPYSNTISAEYLKKYHGISFNLINLNIKQFNKFIFKKDDQKYYYIIGLDSYWCPWCAPYQKEHDMHLCILDKIDESIFCFDPFITGNTKSLKIDNNEKALLSIFYIEKIRIINNWNDIPYDIIKLLKKQFEKNGMFKMLEKFSNELFFRIDEEKKRNNNVKNSKFFLKLKRIENSRKNFMKSLKLFFCKKNILFNSLLFDFYDQFEVIINDWTILKLHLLRYYMKPKDSLVMKINTLLSDIIKREIILSDKLAKIITDEYL